mgnify:CR=1 FL=1
MKRYRITDHSQEFQCPECGDPLDVGDTAVEAYGLGCYCSRACAEAVRVALLSSVALCDVKGCERCRQMRTAA